MEFYPDKKQAAEIDRYTQEVIGIPGIVLMERAALKLASCIDDVCLGLPAFDKNRDRILAVVESGNNGGDAVAAVRILKCIGYDTYIYEVNGIDRKSESYKNQISIAKNLGVKVIGHDQKEADPKGLAEEFSAHRIIIDGIFGVGLSREVRGIHKAVMEAVNTASGERGSLVVGCDIPSGISSDNGCILGEAVRCNMTVTFQYKKYGMLINKGREYSGKIICEDIGLYEPCTIEDMAEVFKDTGSALLCYGYGGEEGLKHLPVRTADSNKGDNGKVLIVAGSKEIFGALGMCTESCYRSGAGLVKVVTDIVNRDLLMSRLPEAMLLTYDTDNEDDSFWDEYGGSIDWADVILIGPGLGTSDHSQKLLKVLADSCREGQSIVADADALNIIAASGEEMLKAISAKLGPDHIVITPHMAEMKRLLKDSFDMSSLKENRAKIAADYSFENGLICVLKDARTVVTSAQSTQSMVPVYVNTTGNSGMAKGGSGDVLAGMIAAYLARNKKGMKSNYEVCTAVVNMHGLAGDKASKRFGESCMLAGDIIEGIE